MTEITPALRLSAYFLGRRIAGQRRKPERVPVAYLYNGVRLPKLPDLDKSMWPYAYIQQHGSTFDLVYSTTPLSYGTHEYSQWLEGNDDGIANVYRYKNEQTNWTWNVYEEGREYKKGLSVILYARTNGIWANTNLYYAENLGDEFINLIGTLYLEKSDPIPVYE